MNEARALQKEFQTLEVEYRSELIKEGEERAALEAENAKPEADEKPDEFRAACKAFSLLKAAAAANGAKLEGRELEVHTELENRQGGAQEGGVLLPWEALDGGFEERADAYVTDADAKAGGFFQRPQLSPIERLFETSSAAMFGARVLSVSGNPRLPELTAGASAGWTADGASKDAETITVSAHTPVVHTLQCRYVVDRAALVPGGMDESLLRADLAQAIREGVDKGFWGGTGSGNQPSGLKASLTATTVAEVPDIIDFVSYAMTDLGDAKMSVTNDMRGLMGVCYAMNPLLFGLLQQTDSSVHFATQTEHLNAMGIKLLGSANVDAIASNTKKTTTVFSYARGSRPHANLVTWGAPELIRNPYSIAGGARVGFTILCFMDFLFSQKANRFKARTVQTVA